MNITAALLCLLGIVGMASLHHACPHGCKERENATWPHLSLHVSEPKSIASWTIKMLNYTNGGSLQYADCDPCKVTGYHTVKISVTLYLPKPRKPSTSGVCVCPFRLTVGCTCVQDSH